MIDPASTNFAQAADRLRQEEIGRLSQAVVPTVESLRLLHGPQLQELIVRMLERSGHEVLTIPNAGNLVTMKNGEKHLVAIAKANKSTLVQITDLMRLHEDVLAVNAARGFFVTTRGFTRDAEAYVKGAPLKLMDGEKLIISIKRGMEGITMPDTYRAMCRQCGDVVRHRLDKAEARACSNGHVVAPTIALAALTGLRVEGGSQGSTYTPPRQYSRRDVNAHNNKYGAKMRRTAKPKPKGRAAKASIDVDHEFDADLSR
jgi:hypothetical protein